MNRRSERSMGERRYVPHGRGDEPLPVPMKHTAELCDTTNKFLVVELSNGQMVDDIRLAVNGRREVHFYSRMGGAIPSVEELVEQTRKYI